MILGTLVGREASFGFEISEIIVFEDNFLCAGVTDSLDHGGMIQAIGENNALGEFAAQCCQG